MKVRKALMAILAGVIGLIVLPAAVGWAGSLVPARPFPAYAEASRTPKTVALRDGLPAPVERYYRTLYGSEVPVIETAVVTGRVKLRPFGIWLPGRFRFTHETGKNYRHYIEATLFNVPLMRVNERYLDGTSLMELPWVTDQGEKLNQAANLGLWAETAAYFPSVLLTDPRVEWKPIDDSSALLVVPFGSGHDTFVVRFDPKTNLVSFMESMRYQDSKSPTKILWINTAMKYEKLGGYTLNSVGAATWLDAGKPWAIFTAEDVRLNVDVRDYVRARGL